VAACIPGSGTCEASETLAALEFNRATGPFPNASGGRWQISSGGGLQALWSKNGRELFYETMDNRIMVVDYSVDGGTFVPGSRGCGRTSSFSTRGA